MACAVANVRHIGQMTPDPIFGTAPADFEAHARSTFARIPSPFREYLDGIIIAVEEFADAEMLASVGLDDPWQLTGLYHGHPLHEQSLWDTGDLPPVIRLFRQPLLREWRETGVSLAALIHHVVIHEVGHHFGLSDEDMAALEQAGTRTG